MYVPLNIYIENFRRLRRYIANIKIKEKVSYIFFVYIDLNAKDILKRR